MKLGWISALCVLAIACDEEPKVIDPFPIVVDLSAGPVVLKAQEKDQEAVEIAVDVLSPITILDSYRGGGEVAKAKRRLVELTVFGLSESGESVARVRFPQTPAYDVHPCDNPDAPPTICQVGLEGNTQQIFGILGSDILSRSSVRFDFPDSEIRFFPDAAGSDSERTLACDAVFDTPFAGGGTLLIGGNEVSFSGNRPTLGVCIHSEAIPEPGIEDSETGTDLQMAVSTAMGPTIISEAAYLRYAENEGVLPLENLAATTLYLPSGPVPARFGEIAFMALVGEVGDDSDGRGPCRELYANARMRSDRSCSEPLVDCPCPSARKSCKAAAAVELNKLIPVAIVDSSLPLLQALRDELRPDIAEIDGVIGVQALDDLQVEFDFPNNRLLMRCQDLADCVTRPQVRAQTTLRTLDACRQSEEDDRVILPDAGLIE